MTARTSPAAVRTVYFDIADTAFGPMLIAGEGRSVAAIRFRVDEAGAGDAVASLRHETRGAFDFHREGSRVAEIVAQVRQYLAGERTEIDVDVDLGHVTDFRRNVLLETRAIPRGAIATYAEIARRAGRPRAFRAVGNTMRTNPIPIIIPCHRVIGTDGSLTGFAGDLDMKRRLLALEGVTIGVPKR